jgi:transcriptional regulator with XRE-family HTH domain
MTGAEATAARVALGLSQDDLAATSNMTPAVVAAWEADRIKVPRSIAVDLNWRVARDQRLAALASSGLPECQWIAAFEAEPTPDKLEAQTAQLEKLVAHSKTCEVCKAREAFVTERFPPMPPAPRPSGWLGLVMPIAERVQQLPSWARPAATGALIFIAYSLLRLIVLLPAILRSPLSGLLTAAAGIAASGSIGALLGFLYGQYRRLRGRRSARRVA